MALLVAAAIVIPGASFATVSVFPTGVTISDPTRVMPGAVIFTARTGVTYAIDTEGRLINVWTSPDPTLPLLSHPRPTDAGTLLTFPSAGSTPGCGFQCGSRLIELDAAGEVVWEYEDTEGRFLHHDMWRKSNGNTAIMCSLVLDRPEISPLPITDDCVVEVDAAGEVVWFWQVADHFDELGLSDEAKALIADAGGDWGHGNSMAIIPDDSPHTDPRFRPGNVIISLRDANLILIVDRDTDEVVWTYDQLIGQHHVEMIPGSYPGGGNLLAFDNGGGTGYPLRSRPFSRVVEIDPTDSSTPFVYTAASSGRPTWTFFSHFVSSAQRLPNGNTLIDEGKLGRVFEIDASGNIVWEFVMPVFGTQPDGTQSNHLFRAYKVPPDWAGP